MTDQEMTKEQIDAAAQAAADEKARKAAEKEAAKAEKAAAKAARDAEKAAAKAAKEAAAAEAKEAKEAAAAEAKAAKEAAAAEKAAAKAARVRQNGVLRPLPESLCGQAWAIFDEVSTAKGGPATVAECMDLVEERGLNPGNVRAEYGQWRKFYGIPPQPRAKVAVEEAPAETEAPAAALTEEANEGADYHDSALELNAEIVDTMVLDDSSEGEDSEDIRVYEA